MLLDVISFYFSPPFSSSAMQNALPFSLCVRLLCPRLLRSALYRRIRRTQFVCIHSSSRCRIMCPLLFSLSFFFIFMDHLQWPLSKMCVVYEFVLGAVKEIKSGGGGKEKYFFSVSDRSPVYHCHISSQRSEDVVVYHRIAVVWNCVAPNQLTFKWG